MTGEFLDTRLLKGSDYVCMRRIIYSYCVYTLLLVTIGSCTNSRQVYLTLLAAFLMRQLLHIDITGMASDSGTVEGNILPR